MAVTVVTPTTLVINTGSSSLTDSAGCIVPTSAADGWTFDPGTKGAPGKMIFKFVAGANADTITFVAGTNPPALLAALGVVTIALTANQVKYIVIEGARFIGSTGLITVTCTDTGTKAGCLIMPNGYGGGTGIS